MLELNVTAFVAIVFSVFVFPEMVVVLPNDISQICIFSLFFVSHRISTISCTRGFSLFELRMVIIWIFFPGLLMNLSYLDSLMHIKALRTAYNLQKAVGNQQIVCT